MEILTRVMAKTVYRIDLLDPPLQHDTRKGRRKIFEGRGKTSKTQSFSTGWGGVNTTTTQPPHGHAALERNVSAGEASGNVAQTASRLTVKRSSLPRSASEPGMLQKQASKHHNQHGLHTLHSDSCVTSAYAMQSHTKVEELIQHREEEQENDSIGNLETFQAKMTGRCCSLHIVLYVMDSFYHNQKVQFPRLNL